MWREVEVVNVISLHQEAKQSNNQFDIVFIWHSKNDTVWSVQCDLFSPF